MSLWQRSHDDSSLDSVEHKRFERVWAVITEVGLEERHFNEIQAGYRKLASTWLLASFAGMGFVASTPGFALPVPRLLVITMIGAAAAVGLGLLWIIDTLVYHRLLLACFEEGRDLEKRYRFLPKVRTRMWGKQGKGTGAAPQVAWFYNVAIAASLFISGAAWAGWLLPQSTVLAVLVSAGYLVVIFVTTATIRRATERVEAPLG